MIKPNSLFKINSDRFGKLQDKIYSLSWIEDSFLSDKNEKEKIGTDLNFKKIYFSYFLFIFILFILIFRSWWLQVKQGDYYTNLAQGNKIRLETVEAKRGIIYDRNLIQLVKNQANFLLYCIPADLPKNETEREMIFQEISSILPEIDSVKLNNSVKEIKSNAYQFFSPFFIADNIPYNQAIKISLKSTNWSGIILSNKTRREYLTSQISLTSSSTPNLGIEKMLSSSHLLGYTGKITKNELEKNGPEYSLISYLGKTGLEYFYEPELRGLNGQKQIEVDAMGKEKRILKEILPKDGKNLILSLDFNLQNEIEKILRQKLTELKLAKASVVALNPQNGEVLAMVSLPTYNNNDFAQGIKTEEYNKLINDPNQPLINRSIAGEYPSGSTIKPVILAAALEEGIVTGNTSFLSSGGLRIDKWFFPDWKAGGHGQTAARKALAESVNTYFYYIGGGYQDFKGLGLDKIVQYAELFGLNTQTGIDLLGEMDGFLPSKTWKKKTKNEAWYIGDTYHVAIGQGDLLVTPLQVALYTSVFANQGKLYRPHLVKTIINSDKYFPVSDALIRENFISQENIQIIREGLRLTVTGGSARSLGSLPIEVAGKTGTAQWSSKKNPHAWFTGFAPYENSEIVLTVLIEEGKEGSTVAVPVAKEIFDWYFKKK